MRIEACRYCKYGLLWRVHNSWPPGENRWTRPSTTFEEWECWHHQAPKDAPMIPKGSPNHMPSWCPGWEGHPDLEE